MTMALDEIKGASFVGVRHSYTAKPECQLPTQFRSFINRSATMSASNDICDVECCFGALRKLPISGLGVAEPERPNMRST